MHLVPIVGPPVVVASEPPEGDEDVEELTEPEMQCGRCRLHFPGHPSIASGNRPKWWVCPACRSRLFNEDSN